MKEIGSEFWNVPLCEKNNIFFPKSTRWFLSGRVALSYILLDIKKISNVKTAWLPSWCCDSMIKPFYDNGIDVNFYSVYFDGQKLVQEVPKNAELILVLDYFGFCNDNDYSEYEGIVIRDLTHSVFCKKYDDADYYFGSVRKWCGIWTGGFAWGETLNYCNIEIQNPNQKYVEIRKTSMEEKKKYIDGKTHNKAFLESFSQAEEILDEISDIEFASDRDIRIAGSIDVNLIKDTRRKNAEVLLKELGEIAIFNSLGEDDCPLFVPIFIKNRDIVRRELIDSSIYCPVHWPISDLHRLNDKTKLIYQNEISIVCDQRYTVEDMERIVEIIKKGV